MRALVLVVCTLAAAGCLSPTAPDPAPDGGDGAVLTTPVRIEDELTGCHEGAVVFLVPFETAAKGLPAGFEPADAQDLLATPAPTGRGAVYMNAVACDGSTRAGGAFTEAQLAVLVKDPDVPGEREDAIDFYEVERWLPAGALLDEMRALGWKATEGSPSIDVSTTPLGGALGGGSVEDADGEVYAFSFTAPAGNPLSPKLTGIGRFWHVTDAGTGHVDYRVDAPVAAGGARCTMRDDTAAAQILGRTSCAPGDGGVVLMGFDMGFSIDFAPDVFPAAHAEHGAPTPSSGLVRLGE